MSSSAIPEIERAEVCGQMSNNNPKYAPMTPQAARPPAWPVVLLSSCPPRPRSSVPCDVVSLISRLRRSASPQRTVCTTKERLSQAKLDHLMFKRRMIMTLTLRYYELRKEK